MDMSCSLDVLIQRDTPVHVAPRHADPMAIAIKHTQEKIDAAFAGATKVKARRRVR